MPSTRPMAPVEEADRPRLARHIRMRYDASREQHVLLSPETIQVINPTGAAIINLCDGDRTVADILAELARTYADVPEGDVRDFLSRLVANRSMEVVDG